MVVSEPAVVVVASGSVVVVVETVVVVVFGVVDPSTSKSHNFILYLQVSQCQLNYCLILKHFFHNGTFYTINVLENNRWF